MQTPLKIQLKEKKVVIGSWITIGHPCVAEIMAKAGFDYLTVDMEHSAITLPQAQQLLRIIELFGVTPLVRVDENNPSLIKRVMDAGAHGVIVPMVNSRADALKAVNAVKYPPAGTRGVGLARAQGYGLEFKKYKNRINDESIVVVQIETIKAIDNLEKILEVEGVDASIIGPYDLSASLGYPGEFERAEVAGAVKRYIEICRRKDKCAGFHIVPIDTEKVKNKIKEGFIFIAFSLDTLFLGERIKTELEKIKT